MVIQAASLQNGQCDCRLPEALEALPNRRTVGRNSRRLLLKWLITKKKLVKKVLQAELCYQASLQTKLLLHTVPTTMWIANVDRSCRLMLVHMLTTGHSFRPFVHSSVDCGA